MYIPIALVAGFLNAVAQILRGYKSEIMTSANLFFCSAWVYLPLVALVILKHKQQYFRLPWVSFDKKTEWIILILLLIAGLGVIVGSQFLNMSFNSGQKAQLNDAITSSLILTSCVMIICLSYFVNGEKITCVQVIGGLVVVFGVIMIGALKDESLTIESAESSDYMDDESYYQLMTVVYGILAAFFFCVEVVLIKYVSLMGKDNTVIGASTPLLTGLIASVIAFVYILTGGIEEEHYNLNDCFIFFIGGSAEALGAILMYVSVSLGVAGISFLMANTCCIYVLIFNYFVMEQDVTLWQVSGILITLGGASIISLEEQISQAYKRN